MSPRLRFGGLRRLRRSPIAVAAVLIAAMGCGRDEGADLGPAKSFVAGPRKAGLIVLDEGGAPRRLASDGSLVLPRIDSIEPDPYPIFELPADVEDDGETASVLLVTGRTESGHAVIRRWRRDGSLEEVARLPLEPEERAEPRCAGTATQGVLTGSFLTIVASDSGGPRRAWVVDVRGGRSEVWPDVLFAPPPEIVSVSPSGQYLTIVRRHGGTSEMAIASRTASEPPRVVGAVEPIAPYWLSDVDVVMFVRTGGSIAKLLLPSGEPEWLVPGSFSAALPRNDVAVREAAAAPDRPSRRVAVEKLGADGFVQITWVEPFESGSEREKHLTNGSVDHFGAAWSADGRSLAFRQRERRGESSAAEERVIVVDTQDGYAATSLVTRTVAVAQSGIGPAFGSDPAAVFAVVEGRLRRFDLELVPSGR